ncbi:MAG: hypothetical protein Q4A64_01820 [Porphyromonadaceae bacterium]|nr:hypothetical protein [Porphyromonadaceae bacterium]
MTNREEQELARLEVNMRRLIELSHRQANKIAELQQTLSEQTARLYALQEEVNALKHSESLSQVADALAVEGADRAQARAYLADIIKEIDYCIAQL